MVAVASRSSGGVVAKAVEVGQAKDRGARFLGHDLTLSHSLVASSGFLFDLICLGHLAMRSER